MGMKKRGKKKKIKIGIEKKVPKIKLKKKKKPIISREKNLTKKEGLFQPFIKVYENFRKNSLS